MTPMIAKVTYATLFVSDQDKALEFYAKLGFEKRADNPTPTGPRFLSLGLKGQDLQVVLWPGTKGATKASPGYRGYVPGAVFLETDNIQKEFELLRSQGVRFEEAEPVQLPYGKYATAVDPDGNRITIRQA
jgi:catechol 2,3-dioxygenase-like lactoylglutathione lyase family enzyme